MSIFKLDCVKGTIATGRLPSGDMTVSGPTQGPLEQVIFDVCRRFKGQKNASYGGWIIPHKDAATVEDALAVRCIKIS